MTDVLVWAGCIKKKKRKKKECYMDLTQLKKKVSIYMASAFRISRFSSAGEISDALLKSKISIYNPSE